MIDIDKFDEIAGLAFTNCLRFHFDAILLFDHASYPSAYFLSVLSVEEYGKVINILDLIYFYSIGSWTDEIAEEFFNNILFHTYKQKKYASYHKDILPKEYIENVYKGKLEIEKQNAVYVGLPKNKKKIDLNGKIINPLRVGKLKTKSQITYFNDCLLRLVLGNIKGVYAFEAISFSEQLNRELYSDLVSQWKYVSASTKKELRRLENFEDFKEE